jgi:hypothetical protein
LRFLPLFFDGLSLPAGFCTGDVCLFGAGFFPDALAGMAAFFCRCGRKKPGILVPDSVDTAGGFFPLADWSL